MWFWKLSALGFAGILDLAAGTLIIHLLSVYFSHPLLWWQYIIGATLGASPDIDLFLAFAEKNQDGHHEYLTHRPLFGIPFAIVVGFLVGGEFWAYAAGIGVFWHYLHDTQGFLCLYDNGIAWFYPFSRKYWGIQDRRLVSRTFDEHLGREESSFGNIYEGYLTPTRRAITEFVLTGIFFGYVAGDLWGLHSGLAAAFLFWYVVVASWVVYYCRHKRR